MRKLIGLCIAIVAVNVPARADWIADLAAKGCKIGSDRKLPFTESGGAYTVQFEGRYLDIASNVIVIGPSQKHPHQMVWINEANGTTTVQCFVAPSAML
jgi:hypothetical protein